MLIFWWLPSYLFCDFLEPSTKYFQVIYGHLQWSSVYKGSLQTFCGDHYLEDDMKSSATAFWSHLVGCLKTVIFSIEKFSFVYCRGTRCPWNNLVIWWAVHMNVIPSTFSNMNCWPFMISLGNAWNPGNQQVIIEQLYLEFCILKQINKNTKSSP